MPPAALTPVALTPVALSPVALVPAAAPCRADPRRCRSAPRSLLGGLLLAGLLAACSGGQGEGPLQFYREATGEALQGRQMPPGVDAPYPNLATVPARPERGAASARESLSAALAAARTQAGQPVASGAPVPEPPATEGSAAVPRTPPAPPRLAAAPPIGAGPATLLLPGTADRPAQTLPEIGRDAPAAPPAELLAPPPPDLSAPPPPTIR